MVPGPYIGSVPSSGVRMAYPVYPAADEGEESQDYAGNGYGGHGPSVTEIGTLRFAPCVLAV